MTSPRRQVLLWNSRQLGATVLFYALLSTAASAWAQNDLCLPDPACSALDHQAEIFVRTKEDAKALEAYEKAFAIKPEPRLILNIGRLHHRLGQYGEALQRYRQFESLVPSPEPDMARRLTQYIKEAEFKQHSPGSSSPDADGTGERPPQEPVYKRPWFWTTIGLIAAAAIAGGIAGGVAGRPEPYSGTTRF